MSHIVLNFGARVSSFYWARAAGLLLRLLKRLVRVRHSGLIYVGDILSLLNRTSAPLWASVIVILLRCLRVPVSWHKCALGPSVVWIGWQMDFECFTVRLDPAKLSPVCRRWQSKSSPLASAPSVTWSASLESRFSGVSARRCHLCTPTNIPSLRS